jgi:hypothetical protein
LIHCYTTVGPDADDMRENGKLLGRPSGGTENAQE